MIYDEQGIIMKIIVLILASLFTGQAIASDFCDGFEAGYIAGYKQSSGGSYDPYPPYCPYQPHKGYSDPENDEEHGFIIGYEQGLIDGV